MELYIILLSHYVFNILKYNCVWLYALCASHYNIFSYIRGVYVYMYMYISDVSLKYFTIVEFLVKHKIHN